MYVILYGLHNIGLTAHLIDLMGPIVSRNLLHASIMMGVLLSVLSNLFNNHPALMVGTLTLTNMHRDPLTLKISYLANIVGSDIGSLLLPMGTLATLMWMYIVNRGKVKATTRNATGTVTRTMSGTRSPFRLSFPTLFYAFSHSHFKSSLKCVYWKPLRTN
jgi:Na+/H+ antiporter NhaD/arsenite permease-like protein